MTKTKPMTEFNWGKKFTELQEKQGKLGTQKALISRSFIAHAINQATSKAREEAKAEQREEDIKIIDERLNLVGACGYGDCDDAVCAELNQLKEATAIRQEGK